ncbi:Gfo/Idh/MocA family protein [Candidatus Pantoea persica]|uniref:Gfo/Idh/MocA family protein n=1 Tax=Candidatus Pantoea persica TaxID=2518128 RepID=UPI00215D90C4|nr:Gfo/Idh/MocA family oxidoreductase [Candidatus Pantoea persica]MBA2814286.1 putative UDP-kanosamine synthase oxidoreductase subunit [Candidatus Pantoea persica]
MKIAVIGCGNIVVKEHIPAIISLDIKIHALCDISQGNIDSAKKLLDYEVPTYTCYKQLIKKERPDTLVVALPHNLYYDVLIFCSDFPLKIIKEKPFALNLAEAKKFSDLSRGKNLKIFTVCQKRYTPAYELLKQEINDTGEKISHLTIRYTIPSENPNANWRSQFSTSGGGVWLDMGYHVIDIINYLFDGKEVTVNHARLLNSSEENYNVEDMAFVEMECAGVIIFAYISCVEIEKHEDITAYGKSKIFYTDKKGLTVKNKKQQLVKRIEAEDDSPFVRMYKDFLFDSGEAGFERNLSSSTSLMRILEKAVMNSKFNVAA